jgi:hypothetical protein
MPKIPFLEQQLVPSANVGAVRADPGLRSGEFAAVRQAGGAVRQFGDVAADYGLKLKQARAVDQRIQGETQALQAFDEIQAGFRTRRDHDKFGEDFDRQAGELKTRLLEDPAMDPEAKRSLSQFFDRQAVNERAKVQSLAFAKWQDQSRAGLDLALTDAEKRGDSGRARSALEGARAAGYITDQEFEDKRQKVGRNIDYYAALSDIESGQGLSVYQYHAENGFYPELMPEDREKLETYGAKLEKAQQAATADAVEGGVLEVTSTGNYDLAAEMAKVDAAEAAGAIDKKLGAALRAKLRDGDIERTSEQVQAELNAIELNAVLGNLKPEEAKRGVLERITRATSKDASRMLSILKDLKSESEQALTESQKVPPSLKEAYSQIEDLRKVGVFGDRILEDGKDVTEKKRLEAMDKEIKAAREKPGWGDYDPENPEDAKEIAKREAEIRKKLKTQWDEEDRAYNSAVTAVRQWVMDNPKATTEEIREAVNGFLAMPLENAAFQKALKNGK